MTFDTQKISCQIPSIFQAQHIIFYLHEKHLKSFSQHAIDGRGETTRDQ